MRAGGDMDSCLGPPGEAREGGGTTEQDEMRPSSTSSTQGVAVLTTKYGILILSDEYSSSCSSAVYSSDNIPYSCSCY